MEDMFEGLIALVIIAASVIKMMNSGKKVKENAPGKAAAPVRPAAPATRPEPRPHVAPVPAAPTVRPSVHPAQNAGAPEFYKQVSEAIKEEMSSRKPEPGHGAVGRMKEGDSRECAHGSVGGSMAYEGHQEGREKKPVMKRRAAAPCAQSEYRPAMNAQEMRRAVVMAEILKRPQERMAEQARRWNVR